MNMRWVILFATVAEEGSFTRAASRLNTAQPWLSAQIRKLEWELGVKLLTRVNAGVELTPEGRELLPYAKQVDQASRKFRELARKMGDAQSQIVRIGSNTPMFDIRWLRQINDDFVGRFKQFSLRADAGTTPDLLMELRNGQIDFVAAISPLAGEVEDFLSVALDGVRPYILAPRTAMLTSDAASFKGKTIAIPPPDLQPAMFEQIIRPLREAGAEIRQVPEVDKRAMAHLAQAQGMAVLMIHGAYEDFANDAALLSIPLPDIGAHYALFRLAHRELGRAAERYWTLASKTCPANPDPDANPPNGKVT